LKNQTADSEYANGLFAKLKSESRNQKSEI